MVATQFLILLFLSFTLNPLVMVGEDEDTRDGMQERADTLNQEMTRLLLDIEKRDLEQISPMQTNLVLRGLEQWAFAWRALLFAALQQWQLWVAAGVLALLFGLYWWFRKRSHKPDTNNKESSRQKRQKRQKKKEEEYSNVNDLERIFEEYLPWQGRHRARELNMAQKVVLSVTHTIRELSANISLPVLQNPIGVGSAFEGWSAHEDDSIYCFLVPLKPPHGHTFNLELVTAGEMPARNFYINVELVCTCTTQQQVEKMQCLLHQPQEKLMGLSLLQTLCTGPYLDVQKTAHWFSQSVEEVMKALPRFVQRHLKVLPSNRSCKFQVTKRKERVFKIEVIFGVQEGDSDIFLSSQMAQATFTSSTMWPESYAVAEVKFFKHMAMQAPFISLHLACLQTFDSILKSTSFSTYAFKTVMMHLMITPPFSSQIRSNILMQMHSVMRYLHCCLKQTYLNHFFYGNRNVPEEIVLPLDFRTAEPLNLFQHLAQDPKSYAKACRDFMNLRKQLGRMLELGY